MLLRINHITLHGIAKSFALLTILALLNAMTIPMVCGLGWCTPSDKADCCSSCESSRHESDNSNGESCSESACPFAHTGACSGLVFLHETDILPETVMTVEPVVVDFPADYPSGFTFDLIRPPTASC